jgi:hypothetical protein
MSKWVAILGLCLLVSFSGRLYAQQQEEPAATLTVYLKWIGTTSEPDVKISLDCESGDYSGDLYINQGSPDSWTIKGIDSEGILCNVYEMVPDNFRTDIIDCQGLYLLPGSREECTLVNTKIVKHIEMLNRYGKVVMIVLFLAVGLLTMRRLA